MFVVMTVTFLQLGLFHLLASASIADLRLNPLPHRTLFKDILLQLRYHVVCVLCGLLLSFSQFYSNYFFVSFSRLGPALVLSRDQCLIYPYIATLVQDIDHTVGIQLILEEYRGGQ